MNFHRIRTIIDKEWAEIFKNRLVLFTVGFLPIVFTALPLIILATTGSASGEIDDLPPQFEAMCKTVGLGDPLACFQTFLLNQFLILFMMMPLIIPVAIAAYSIVGEKTTRSLEPLLATPITTIELLTAKSLAAALPAIGATWSAFLIFVMLAPLVGAKPEVIQHVVTTTWGLAIFGVGPLVAILAVNFAIMVSSRVSDPRIAEQISGVIVVPIIALVFGQIAGVIVINIGLMLGSIVVLILVDAGAIYLGAQFFQRETILTKWK